MKSEMDFMSMDERQRHCWLLANRGTLFLVGLSWLGVVLWELLKGRVPTFFIVMVPVFALVRYALYRFYNSQA